MDMAMVLGLIAALAAQMLEEATGVPSYDSLDAVAHLQKSERYRTVMQVRLAAPVYGRTRV